MVNREDELFAEIDNSGSFERWCRSGRPHSGHQEQKPKGSGSRSDKHERSIPAEVGFLVLVHEWMFAILLGRPEVEVGVAQIARTIAGG
ncbi:hypothetical protein NL676_029209 [Syzygium grande]|nr:hypothetical protein NL676_029209 [Syzygium grande]